VQIHNWAAKSVNAKRRRRCAMKKVIDNPDDCVCEEGCFGFGECACIWIYSGDEGEDGECRCFCDKPEPDDRRLLTRTLKLSLSSRIGISTREVSVVRLGMVLGTISAAEIAIPVSAAHKRVSLALKETTIEFVLGEAGLVVLGNRS
jgi:hypothetical protein